MGYRMVLGHQILARGDMLASFQAGIPNSSFVRRFVALGGDAHQKGVRPGGIAFFPVGAFWRVWISFFAIMNILRFWGCWYASVIASMIPQPTYTNSGS